MCLPFFQLFPQSMAQFDSNYFYCQAFQDKYDQVACCPKFAETAKGECFIAMSLTQDGQNIHPTWPC